MSLLNREKTAKEILMHHRFPTSTSNVRNACHPFSTKNYFENNYVVVHNGVLSNERVVAQTHRDLGIDYVSLQENGSFNDSEALAFDLARYLEGQVNYLTVSGSIAFIAIKRDKGGKPMTLFFGRNSSNPLKMKKTEFSLTLSSEGEGELIEANQLYSYSYDTKVLSKRYLLIPGGYNYTYHDRSYSRPNYHSPTTHGYTTPPSSTSTMGSVPVVTGKGVGDVPSAATGYDSNEDLALIRKGWDESESAQQLLGNLLASAENDKGRALALCQTRLRVLQERNVALDDLAQEEELEGDEDEALDIINEYSENEENIDMLQQLVDYLTKSIIQEAEGRDKARARVNSAIDDVLGGKEAVHSPAGFRTPSLSKPKAGTRHAVPQINHERKLLPATNPHAD